MSNHLTTGIITRPPNLPLQPGVFQGPTTFTSDDPKNPTPAVSAGNSVGGDALFGTASSGWGVHGESGSNAGVVGVSNTSDGVNGISHDPNHAGVYGQNDKGGMGGRFDAKVQINSDANVTGTLNVQNIDVQTVGVAGNATVGGTLTVQTIDLAGNMNVASVGDVILSDCAECFEVSGPDPIEPGTVMAIDDQGGLRPSGQSYDKRVAGVVSGAGNYRPAIVLGAEERRGNRVVVALVGKAYCKVDAGLAPVEVGDLLTTSDTPGHAMKANDPLKAFGSVIGKALRPFEAGRGLIPVLIALQ